MTLRPLCLAFVSSLMLAGTLGTAQAADRGDVAPVHGTTCRAHEPVLLGAGAEPRAELRIDLDAVANTSRHALETERAYTKTRTTTAAPTPWKSAHQTLRTTIMYRTSAPVAGHLPVDVQFGDPAASAKEAAQLGRVHVVGFFDELDGGAFTTRVTGGSAKSKAQLRQAFAGSDGPITNHLPQQAVGVGATWRVVRCDAVGGTPAMESRVYTLRSVTNGVVVTSFRETIGLDPGHIDLGKVKLGDETVGVRLLSMRGTSTGTERTPLGNSLGEQDYGLTKVAVVSRIARVHADDIKVQTQLVLQRSVR